METDEPEWGLAAIGVSGHVSIEVDEAVSGPDRWELVVADRQLYLRFACSGPRVVKDFHGFLQQHWKQATSGEQQLGSIGPSNVTIINDDEFQDRFWLCLIGNGGCVRYKLDPQDIGDYVKALAGALEDLD